MAHILQQARDAIVAALTGLPTTGANVTTQELYAWQDSQLPALIVSTGADMTLETIDGELLRYDVQVVVTAVARGLGDLAALLDTIALEVQRAICLVDNVNGFSVTIAPVSFTPPEFAADGDQPAARRVMSFLVQSLYSSPTQPDVLV